MEQQLIAEGMPVEEVRSMCDLHSQVTRDVLVQLARPPSIEPGHPLDTFRRENAALKEVIGGARAILAETTDVAPTTDAKEIVFRLRKSANDLMDLDKQYQRKEHALFSCLERHGITGPSKVMWSKDDEVRNLLKRMLVATLGLLPAALSHAIGSDSQRPFAIVIVGGLIAALVMSIFLLPTLYVWIAGDHGVLPAADGEFAEGEHID